MPDQIVGEGEGMNSTPAQEGHAGFPTAADRAAGKLVDRLAHDIGHKAAVAWVHAGAVLSWTARRPAFAKHGMFPGAAPAATADGIRDALKRLADAHPALADFTNPSSNALWDAKISDADAADIQAVWEQHPVTDGPYRPHGYLLGNAYQALSEESRKHRALAQTPRYITDLLMALAWQPAADEHGSMDGFRFIDPSCGTGHILYEALTQALVWYPQGRAYGPGYTTAARLERALRTVHGVDLDPYAALIARLRLVAAVTLQLRQGHDRRPAEWPARMPDDWPVQVAATNALLDRDEPLLERGRYHAIVGNPPYVTPKTAKERDAVRAAYPEVCHMKYALSVPFHQLMTELLVPGGWCAQLTANSFMKREFGTRFVEEYLPRFDLRWVIDTSGAYIPGHGTPTVILAHRNQAPAGDTIATVRSKQGEPKAPDDPSRGLVWRAIEDAVHSKLAFQRLAAGVERELGGEGPKPAAATVPAARRQAIAEQLDLFAGEVAA
jgi:hypothetical protein